MKYSLSNLAASAAIAGTALAASGDFNVLTMNVAGLPAILQGNDVPGDKTVNSKTMGSKFSEYNYDVIHVQEDFNYHAAIYETDSHPYRTATSGGVPFGSGLNSLSRGQTKYFFNYNRVKWNVCSNASGADCLTPKGFTFIRKTRTNPSLTPVRVQVDEGIFVDFYNLHADAGTEPDDLTARAANLKQVADYIDVNSVGNAVVVFGDTNSRYSRTADAIRVFRTQNGLIDTWVELIRNGVEPTAESLCDNPSTTNYCETVDKILYRAGPTVDLKATHWSYESNKFLQADGNVLSDHNPITANFTYNPGTTLRQSNFWGGPWGNWFSDAPKLATLSKPKAASLTVRGADRLDGVSVQLTDGTTFSHGGSGGTAASLSLAANEFWTGAVLCQGQKDSHTRNFYIKATTSTGRTVEAGKTTSDCLTSTAPAGWQIVGFMGQDGDEVDQLAFVYAPQ
ncbi:Endonuclease exonuclease phosphatase family protein [Apiospora kogelbergensis]|uniref:Endonuclease exonuclease phosphatase family protein n=1 Tax=Apiospora kogelbergensis TaxID=1337665 RepID=A0AAW0R854_9PEZI